MDVRDGQFVSGLIRRRAETRNAMVQLHEGSNRYRVKYLDTGGIVVATSIVVGVTFGVGTIVLVRQDASGRAMNRPPNILGYALTNDNGTFEEDLESDLTMDAETLSRIVPESLQLMAGGTSGLVSVYGDGLVSEGVYGDPEIEDSEPQVVDAALIVMRPRATIDCVPGRYALEVAGMTLAEYFDVLPGRPVPAVLWASSGDAAVPALYKIDSETLELLHTFEGTGGGSNPRGAGMVTHAGVLYWIFRTGSGTADWHLAMLDVAAGNLTIHPTALPFIGSLWGDVRVDTEAVYGDAEPRLLVSGLDPATFKVGVWAITLDGATRTQVVGPFTPALNVGEAIGGIEQRYGSRITTSGPYDPLRSTPKPTIGGAAASNAFNAHRIIASRPWDGVSYGDPDGTFVAAGTTAGNGFLVGDLEDVAVTAQVATTGIGRDVVQCRDRFYLITAGTGGGKLYAYHMVDGLSLLNSGLGGGDGFLATDDEFLYYIGDDRVPKRIDPTTGAVLATGPALPLQTIQIEAF